MKRMILYIIILIISVNCMGQNMILNLQQIEFKDKMLTKTLSDIVKSESDCFSKADFYILDFFQSSLYSSKYYLSINKFAVNDKTPKSIAYYVVINNIVFFVSNKISVEIFNILPLERKFIFEKEEIPIIGGDYHFLIQRTTSGHYWVLLKTCGE